MKKETKVKDNKYGLLKVLGISFLVFAVLSWIIPTGSYSGAEYTADATSPVGLYGLFINPFYSIGIFVQYVVVFLAIGGLYGVLNKTGVYSRMIEGISKKVSAKKTLFLVLTVIVFALLSSLVGSQIILFIFVPFAIAILMTLGYDKITSLAATVGSILVGVVGSTYGNSYIFKSFLSMDANNGIVYRIILFVVITALYVFFILCKNGVFAKFSKNNKKVTTEKPKKGKKKVTEVLEKVEEKVKKVEIPLYDGANKENKKKSLVPLVIMLSLLTVILLVGAFNWYYTFGIDLFNNLYTSIMSFEVGGIEIFAKIFGSLPQLGYLGNYDIAAILVIATLIIGWIYGEKFSDLVDAFVAGAKKMLLPAVYVMFASIVFAVMVNSSANICATIIHFLLGLTSSFNVFTTATAGLVGSYFFNDFPYLVNGIYGVLASYDATVYPVISIVISATYGLAMLILPVSISLIAGLKYTDVSYKEWFKYIWKFLVEALVLVIIFALIVLAIVK